MPTSFGPANRGGVHRKRDEMSPLDTRAISSEINLNDYVFVELSELGEHVLRQYLENEDFALNRYHSDTPWYRTPDERFNAWPLDERGRYRFQIYEFMAIFGPHTPNCATSVDLPFKSMNVTVVRT